MIEFNILTIFPEMFENFTSSSICARAISSKLIDVNLYNFRDYTLDKHKRVDDYPFGGGAGMLIAPQPVFDCFSAVHEEHRGGKELNVYMSPCIGHAYGKTIIWIRQDKYPLRPLRRNRSAHHRQSNR